MNENVLKEILAEICEEEIAELSNFPPFKPSLRHRYTMMLIFSSLEKRIRRTSVKQPRASASKSRPLRLGKRLVILIAVIVCAALLTGFILVYISKNFHGTVNENNTQLFAINMENCPKNIEYEYYLPVLPEGFEMAEHSISSYSVYNGYKNKLSGQIITLFQFTKDMYSRYYNTEDNNFEEITINDHEGIYLCFSYTENVQSIVVWDNGDYIIELTGDLSKNELVNLAKSAKILEN